MKKLSLWLLGVALLAGCALSPSLGKMPVASQTAAPTAAPSAAPAKSKVQVPQTLSAQLQAHLSGSALDFGITSARDSVVNRLGYKANSFGNANIDAIPTGSNINFNAEVAAYELGDAKQTLYSFYFSGSYHTDTGKTTFNLVKVDLAH